MSNNKVREIRFRAWDKIQKKMCDVVGAQFSFTSIEIWNKEGDLQWQVGKFIRPIKDVILMQYTGLKDKNGKEIYEGDIVKAGNEQWTIEYRPARFKFVGAYGRSLLIPEDTSMEVIGNIYENPELVAV